MSQPKEEEKHHVSFSLNSYQRQGIDVVLPDLTEIRDIIKLHGTMHIKIAYLLQKMKDKKQIEHFTISDNYIYVFGNPYTENNRRTITLATITR